MERRSKQRCSSSFDAAPADRRDAASAAAILAAAVAALAAHHLVRTVETMAVIWTVVPVDDACAALAAPGKGAGQFGVGRLKGLLCPIPSCTRLNRHHTAGGERQQGMGAQLWY